MLSIVKSVSREDDSPIVSPSPRRATLNEEQEQPEVLVNSDLGVSQSEPEPLVEADREIQEINSSAPAASATTPTQILPTTSGAKTPSRDTSVLTPLTAMGKKLFRTNSEMSPTTPNLSKSPSFFRSLSRPPSRSSDVPNKDSEDQKKGLLSKSPSLLRSLSQSLFGNREANESLLPGKGQSRLSTPAEGPLTEVTAAATIQRAARIRQAKQRTQERREKARDVQRQAGAWSLWAVSSIQRIVRGKLARQRMKRIRKEREVLSSLQQFHPSFPP